MFPSILISTNKRSWDDCHDDSDLTVVAKWVLEQAEALLEKRHTIKWSKIVIKEPQKHIEITSLEDKIKYSEFKPGQRDVILEYDHDIHDMNKIHEEIHKDLTRAQIIYFSVVFTRNVSAS